MKHEQFLKILSIFIKKPMKKGSLVNNSYIFWFCQLFHVVQYVLLLNAKVTTDPIKHQEPIVDETWAILKNSINFHKKSRWRKGRSWINPTFFEPMLILSTLFCSAVCPLVKCKRYDGSDKASRVYSRWNMSNS